MATIKAFAHLNELTKDVTNDYYLTPETRGTLYTEDIIKRIADREIATSNVNGTSFVGTFFDECIRALTEGYNVVTPLFRASLGLQGVVYSYDLGHTVSADRLNTSVKLTQGDDARKAVSSLSVEIHKDPGSGAPVIQSVMDPNKKEADTIYVGNMVLIQGLNIALRGDDPTVGITFTPAGSDSDSPSEISEAGDAPAVASAPAPVFISPDKVYPNTNTKLQFTLPAAVTAGQWNVKVVSQASGNSKMTLKEPRENTYAYTVTVV